MTSSPKASPAWWGARPASDGTPAVEIVYPNGSSWRLTIASAQHLAQGLATAALVVELRKIVREEVAAAVHRPPPPAATVDGTPTTLQ